jgi:hypothetical protein
MRLSWTEHVIHTKEMRKTHKIMVGKPEGKRPLRDLGIDVIIIEEWLLIWGGFFKKLTEKRKQTVCQ